MIRWLAAVVACGTTACGFLMSDLSDGSSDDAPGTRDRGDDGSSGGAGGGAGAAPGDGAGGGGVPPPTNGASTSSSGSTTPGGGGGDAGTTPPAGGNDGGGPAPTPSCKNESKTFSPTAISEEPDGPVAWSSMNAAMQRGYSGYAVAQLEGTARSKKLVASFAASVPANAQIQGFKVSVWHMDNAEIGFVAPTLRIGGKSLPKSTNASLDGLVTSFGSDTDLWNAGARLTAAFVSNAAVAFSVEGRPGGAIPTKTAAIDGFAFTVFYCVPQ